MDSDPSSTPVYEVPTDALRVPWVSRSLLLLIRNRRPAPRRHIGAACLAAVFSVLFHALLIGTAILGVAQPRVPPPPERQGSGASAVSSDQEAVMTLILINSPSEAPQKDLIAEDLASHGLAPINLPVVLLSLDDLPAFETSDQGIPDQAMAPAAADPATHALLFGRYVGQMSARVERAWVRPRTPINGTFTCQVRIKQ